MIGDAAAKPLNAHIWAQEKNEHYVEPAWVSARLFAEISFQGGEILDPCCGFGRIPRAAEAAGYIARGHDVVDRGYLGGRVRDFLSGPRLVNGYANVVMNPPFKLARNFIETACEVAAYKVCSIMPTRRLNAAGNWLRHLPLTHILYLTPRPSMPPGALAAELEARGLEPQGGKQDFCWLIFDRSSGEPRPDRTIGWLHRDKGLL